MTTFNLIPFKINILESELTELKQSLKNSISRTIYPTFESTSNKKYGIQLNWLNKTKLLWENDYLNNKFRSIEQDLNELPHFKVKVNYSNNSSTLELHLIHYPSTSKNAIPLLLLHGWPGSFLEFVTFIRLLKTNESNRGQAYSIVAPSMPGYLFSQAPPIDKDFGIEEVGEIMNNLMINLNYNEYVIQAGDWGSLVAKSMANRFKKNVKCLHLNFIPAPPPSASIPFSLLNYISPSLKSYTIPSLLASFIQTLLSPLLPTSTTSILPLDEKDKESIEITNKFIKSGRGYSIEHSTRPSTIGFAINSNPVALLAWIGEKFLEWTDEDPSTDEILTSLTFWYLTNTFPTSIYPYRHLNKTPSVGKYVTQPVGFSSFAKEITPTPKSWAEKTCNLVWYRYHSSGGHFAAMEKPEVLMKDLNEFLGENWEKLKRESKL